MHQPPHAAPCDVAAGDEEDGEAIANESPPRPVDQEELAQARRSARLVFDAYGDIPRTWPEMKEALEKVDPSRKKAVKTGGGQSGKRLRPQSLHPRWRGRPRLEER